MRFLWMGLALAGVAAVAQDTRTVVEPVIPKSCAVLRASLTATPDENGGRLRDEDEAKLDTEKIQTALDKCQSSMAVELAAAGAKNAFLTGPLELRNGVTLLVDKGVTLFGSRDPKVYEMKLPDAKPDDPIKCGTSFPRPGQFGSEQTIAASAAVRRGGCRPLISIANVTNAALMGEGTIDGRGYAKLIGHNYSWWEMARKAEPKDDIYFSTRLIVASHADGLVMYKITLHNSPNYHVSVGQTNGYTVWGVHLQTPVNKASPDARNTDGIDPGNSTNITIAHSWIDNGDDNIAIKANVQHMSVLDNHFYTGHGMSIGSEATGDAFVLVDGLTEDHTTSGIRIKSNVTRGGLDHDLTYKNICMRDVANPIAISPYYTNQTVEGFVDPGYKGTKIPDYKKIVLQNVVSTTAGNVLIAGIDEAHRTEITLADVIVRDIKAAQVHLAFADITLINGGTNLEVSQGGTVKVVDQRGGPGFNQGFDGRRYTETQCKDKFVPMR